MKETKKTFYVLSNMQLFALPPSFEIEFSKTLEIFRKEKRARNRSACLENTLNNISEQLLSNIFDKNHMEIDYIIFHLPMRFSTWRF